MDREQRQGVSRPKKDEELHPDECSEPPARLGKQRVHGVKKVIFLFSLGLQTHPDRFEEVQVGQEVALRLIQPVTGGLAYNFLSQVRHVVVGNVNKLFQWGRVAEVSEMEAETFRQDLDRGNQTQRLRSWEIEKKKRAECPASVEPLRMTPTEYFHKSH